MKYKPAPGKRGGLSPSVQALLAEERVSPAQPALVRARLMARAREALENAPSAAPPPPSVPRRTTRLLLAAAVVALLAGVAAAFQLSTRAREPALRARPSLQAPQVTQTAPLAPPASAPEPRAVAHAEAPSAPSAAVRAGTQASSRPPAGARRLESLDEELPLLGRARSALARTDYGEVLAILGEHEQRYPEGRLSEEREVLRVKALVALGRNDEARRVAQRFRRRFPRSVLLETVTEMLP